MQLKENARPIFKPKRPVPYVNLVLVDAEFNRLEEQRSKVNYSAWVAPIVVVKKLNGMIKICSYYSMDLNNATESHRYPLSLLEDILATLNGGRFSTSQTLTYRLK